MECCLLEVLIFLRLFVSRQFFLNIGCLGKIGAISNFSKIFGGGLAVLEFQVFFDFFNPIFLDGTFLAQDRNFGRHTRIQENSF